jgi:hypothetical protein
MMFFNLPQRILKTNIPDNPQENTARIGCKKKDANLISEIAITDEILVDGKECNRSIYFGCEASDNSWFFS